MTSIVRIALSMALFCSVVAFAQDNGDTPQPTHVTVHARDYCDPVTFAGIGCHRDPSTGLITLTGFGGGLAAEESVGAWRFVANPASADQGASITITNLGDENTHLHACSGIRRRLCRGTQRGFRQQHPCTGVRQGCERKPRAPATE